jgi:hypothetical protein
MTEEDEEFNRIEREAALRKETVKEHMKQLKLFVDVDDYEVGLVFTWNESENAWVCKMDDDFMQELGPMPVDEAKQ